MINIRWWFRSKQSNRLNLLSYGILVLIISFVSSIIMSAIWQALMKKRDQLGRTSIVYNWVYGDPLGALNNYEKRTVLDEKGVNFDEARRELFSIIDKPSTDPDGSAPLVKAKDLIHNRQIPKVSMFGFSDIRVCPSVATWSKAGKASLDSTETSLFSSFASYAKSLYDKQQNPDKNHLEQTLARALGLSQKSSSQNTGSSISFNVPWIYIASDKGAIAVFPGTDVIADSTWQIESRPWYKAAFKGEVRLFTKGFDNDLLTVSYMNILSKSPMLVRTYIFKFQKEKHDFVICIDIHLRGDEVSGLTPSIADLSTNFVTLVFRYIVPNKLGNVYYITFGISLLWLLTLRYVSNAKTSRFVFIRSKSLLGDISAIDTIGSQDEETKSREKKYGLDVKFKMFSWERKWVNAQARVINRGVNVQKQLNSLRGYELWDVFQVDVSRWRFLWMPFENSRTIFVGAINLIFTRQVMPSARWFLFNRRSFSADEAKDFDTTLLQFIEKNAVLSDGTIEIPYKFNEVPRYLEVPSIPDPVRVVVDTNELMAVHQRRVYIKLSTQQLEELYLKAEVKAAMASGYFEEILDREQINFLLIGSNISRIITFPEENAKLNLTERGKQNLKELLDRYSSASSRSIKRVDIPIHDEGDLRPVYDFAILNESVVIVAHFTFKATGIDNASGKPTKTANYIEGYISWRPSDIEYYLAKFEDLRLKSKGFSN